MRKKVDDKEGNPETPGQDNETGAGQCRQSIQEQNRILKEPSKEQAKKASEPERTARQSGEIQPETLLSNFEDLGM